MELTGHWRAAPADEALRRDFHLPEFAADDWLPVDVPGHWHDVAGLVDAGEVLYRHVFEHGDDLELGPDDRAWLELDGLFYTGDVYLDGAYLGDTEGYFVPHAFDVSDQIRSRREHHLAVEVDCSPSGSGKRRAIMGVYDGGNDILGDVNPGGIWAPVRIRRTGPVRIGAVRAICTAADAGRAEIAVRVTLSATAAQTVRLVSDVAGTHREIDHRVAHGDNEIEWVITVPRPTLWWPRRLGDQPLHDLGIGVRTADGRLSDSCTRRLGFRSVRLRRWRLEVNGERMQVKGVNTAPTGGLPAHATPERVEHDLGLAVDAGFDLVRPYAHVATPAYYATADRLGLLVWQDLPLLGPASNGLRGRAVRHAAAMVAQLGHHPSVATWNGHVSPAPDWMQSEQATWRSRVEKVAAHQAPTWSKSVLDRSIKRVFEHHDGSRPATAFTGVLPHLPRLDGSATHLWFGWRRGSERDLADFAARVPSQVRWVAELGAQSIPLHDAVLDRIDWPSPDLARLHDELGYETRSFDRYVPPTGHGSASEWAEASQLYQAGLLRRQIETLRRLKYRPTGGFCVHFLADAGPAVSASLVGHDGTPKLAYHAVAEACLPVIVVADRLPVRLRPGEPVALDVHVVSDEREALEDAVVDAEITWPGGSHRWRFAGTVGADAVTRVGTLSWVAPTAPGLATLHLRLSGPAEAANRYDTTIRA